MSKLKRELDLITPPGDLKDRVKAAVDGVPGRAEPKPEKAPWFKWHRFAALAAALVIFAGAAFAGIILSGGDTRPEFGLISFKSVSELQAYIKEFNRKKANTDFISLPSTPGGTVNDAAEGAAGKDGSKGDAEHSTTNNQVSGVAESDVVHTDGDYIYTLSYYNLAVIDAESLTVAANVKYDNFFPDSMFLLEREGLLAVIGSEYDYNAEYFKSGHYGEMVAAYDCCYWYSNTVVIKIYEIDGLLKGESGTLRELKFRNAYFNSARMIGGNLYLVLSAYNYFMGGDIWIPQVYDSRVGETKELPIGNIYAAANNNRDIGYTLLAGVDITANEAAEVNAYLGSSERVYASARAFYTTFTIYNYSSYYYNTETAVMRFEIDGINLKYSGGGTAKGTALNQFSMDEYTYESGQFKNKTYFRIATTLWDNSGSRITVFDSGMKKAGELEGLGEKGERIYSVRFNGEKAVVVTYMQTDPLYVVDLSEPAFPKIISALKIPGVSDYLHFLTVTDDRVFAVGRRQAQSGNWLEGVKVSLFDISGTEAAREIAYYNVGEQGSSSEATYNHKAILYFKPSSGVCEVFAFAVDSYTYETVDGWTSYLPDHNLYYYTADATGLKQEILKYSSPEIKVEYGQNNEYYYYYRDSIRRSVIIGGQIYLVGYYGIERYNTADFNGTGNYPSVYAPLEVDRRY